MPTGALTEGALMVALSELLFVAGRYLPGGFVVAFFGALPLALLAFRRGPKTGALGAAAALLLLFVLAGPSGVSLSAPHAASGPLMGALLRAGRGTPACALAGVVVRLLYYPPVFFFYVYLVLGGPRRLLPGPGGRRRAPELAGRLQLRPRWAPLRGRKPAAPLGGLQRRGGGVAGTLRGIAPPAPGAERR